MRSAEERAAWLAGRVASQKHEAEQARRATASARLRASKSERALAAARAEVARLQSALALDRQAVSEALAAEARVAHELSTSEDALAQAEAKIVD